MKTVCPPVKTLALELGLPLFQPADFRAPETRAAFAAHRPDVVISAAYGLILPQAVLDAAALAPLNVHASLLPRYRGAAPVERAIMENPGPDAESGVSIMRMVAALDAGPVYAQRRVPIAGRTAGELMLALAEAGACALVDVLDAFVRDGAEAVANARAQDESQVSYAAKLTREDGRIGWTGPVAEVDARIRAVTPRPGARAVFQLPSGKPLGAVLLPGECGPVVQPGVAPGSIARLNAADGSARLAVACADAWYLLSRLRPDGRKEMDALAFANGYRPLAAEVAMSGRALVPGGTS